MNNKQDELISALLDDELDYDASQRAISGLLDSGQDGMERFARYRLIGDVMRGESAVLAGSVATKVSQALHDEPSVLEPRAHRQPRRWARPAAGLAIAASVAAAAIMVAPQLMTRPGEQGQPMQLAADTQHRDATPATLVAAGGSQADVRPVEVAETQLRWPARNQEASERFDRLMMEHREFGGRTGVNGPVQHIGFVSYDAR